MAHRLLAHRDALDCAENLLKEAQVSGDSSSHKGCPQLVFHTRAQWVAELTRYFRPVQTLK